MLVLLPNFACCTSALLDGSSSIEESHPGKSPQAPLLERLCKMSIKTSQVIIIYMCCVLSCFALRILQSNLIGYKSALLEHNLVCPFVVVLDVFQKYQPRYS